jgi:ornithine carbamoyltransferase
VKEVPAKGPHYDAPVPRHFLTGAEITNEELVRILDRALELKADRYASRALDRRTVALVFEKPSTRTRVSMEVAVAQLGGTPLVLRESETQISRGESLQDFALVLSRYVDAVGVRTAPHETLETLAEHASVPVINLLTAKYHPCQVLADLLTLRERFGSLDGLKLAYVGDGNNMAHSLALMGRIAGIEVRVASPEGYRLEPGVAALDTADAREAVGGADAVYTDVWVSIGDEREAERRRAELATYRVDAELLSHASDRAVVLHCLPAHPGEEITEEVLYGERSVVFDEAENRLHTQKALLELLVVS